MGAVFKTVEDFESDAFFDALIENAETTIKFLTEEAFLTESDGTPITESFINANWDTLIDGEPPTVDTPHLGFLLGAQHVLDEEFQKEGYRQEYDAWQILKYESGTDSFVGYLDLTVVAPEDDAAIEKWAEMRSELLSDIGYIYEWGADDDDGNPKDSPIKLEECSFIDRLYVATDRLFAESQNNIDASDDTNSPHLPFLIGSPLRPVKQANFDGSVAWSNLPTISRQIFPHFERHPGDRRATIRVMTSDGIIWFSSTNLIVQEVGKGDSETVGPLPTFDGTTGIFLQSNPRTFAIKGGLISADDYQWARSWEYNWSRYLKGSETHQSGARVFFFYNGWLLGGHLLNYSLSEAASSPHYCAIQISIYVTDYKPLPNTSGEWEESSGENSGSYYRKTGQTLDEVMGQ